jgi:hypothetical protein
LLFQVAQVGANLVIKAAPVAAALAAQKSSQLSQSRQLRTPSQSVVEAGQQRTEWLRQSAHWPRRLAAVKVATPALALARAVQAAAAREDFRQAIQASPTEPQAHQVKATPEATAAQVQAPRSVLKAVEVAVVAARPL